MPVTHPRGRFQFSLNGFDVGISPDTRVRVQNEAPGITHHQIAWCGIRVQFRGTRGHLTAVSFTGPPKPVLTTFTSYRTGVNTAGVSGYGRGTTAEDKAGAKVTPQSESLAFHESRHGQATLDFISSNPPLAFTGKVGDTEMDFNNAMARMAARCHRLLKSHGKSRYEPSTLRWLHHRPIPRCQCARRTENCQRVSVKRIPPANSPYTDLIKC